ncbi:hypothetical protein F0562_016284 [Nyssa sinensis]|uniref:Regulator of chromosome condensation 1/beta-lactamase-inhibitor protein II n=1 Tax=Nyssa sinensis TaxID=561372 RepID=A0A5J4ZN79_9ASTE|nr:hypothetical protein F0562_016284 [Nyssa sinensis]
MNGSVRDDGVNKMEEGKGSVIFMWGYLPGASPHRSPLLFPVTVQFPVENLAGDSWKSICAGGCGFAMAISESGKLITWGSADDQGQSYLTSGKHGETPEPFLLPAEAATVKAAAGWAHCVSITDTGEVYTWGWKECIPSGKAVHDFVDGRSFGEDDSVEQSSLLTKQVSPPSQVPKSTGGTVPHPENRKAEEESIKRRKISSSKQQLESSISADETLSAPPCLVALDPGVRITSVAAGGRHTLALSGHMKYEAMEDL